MTLGADASRPPFNDEDVRLAEMFAAQTTVAIENARLYEQAQRDARIKAELLREVNHRVKNNLTAIIGLIYIEQRRARQGAQYDYLAGLDDMVNRVQGLAVAHDMLSASEWAPLRLSDLAGRVVGLAQRALPGGKTLRVEVAHSPVYITSDQAHQLALVLNELATNTVKHALGERDRVHVTVQIDADAEMVHLEYRDDGPGFSEEVLGGEKQNVGLDLIQSIVGRNSGGAVVLSNDRGAVTTISFQRKVQEGDV